MELAWQKWAAERGYRMACGDPAVLDEVRAEIEGRSSAGEFDEAFYQENLREFRYLDGVELPRPRTLVVLAIPRPAHRLRFQLEQGSYDAIVPPTYQAYRRTRERLREELSSGMLGPEHGLVAVEAPLKATAVRLGLVTYGRNNITYAEGFGSYHQLAAFVTDAVLGPWSKAERQAAIAPECGPCRICREVCPTGAIGEDRFLLHTERCLTLLNEGTRPWPDWLPASAHHCLVGCLACQEACPRNAGRLRYDEMAESFDAAETALILASQEALPDAVRTDIQAKLDRLGLPGYAPILGRNLGALLAQTPGRTV